MIRRATSEDIEDLNHIQRNVYADELIEDNFQDIISLGLSYVAISGNELVGYLLAHGTKKNKVHLLSSEICNETETECYFLHDMAILKEYRNQNLGRKMFETFHSEHPNYEQIDLISLNPAINFWTKMGFHEKDIEVPQDIYGPSVFMSLCS